MGGIADAFQAHQQGEMQKDQADTQAMFARQQAGEVRDRSLRVAEGQEKQGAETARRSRIEDRKKLEKERARMATSGVSLIEGSPLQVQEDNDITSKMNMNDIYDQALTAGAETRYSGAQERGGLLWEAEQSTYRGKLAKDTAKMGVMTGLFKGAVQGAIMGSMMSGGAGASGSTGSIGGMGKGMGANASGTWGF